MAANAANQSATVTYDPAVTSVAELAGWVRECGYHCAGRSVPMHVCEAMDGSASPAGGVTLEGPEGHHAHAAPDTVETRHGHPAGSTTGAGRGRGGASACWSKTLSVLVISRRAGMRSGTP